MKILACDTTHGTCSAALIDGDIIVAHDASQEHSKQAERLFSIISNVLEQSSCSYGDLDAVGVTVGPGSFTGVRIGIAAARGIGLAADIPVIGVTSFESVAQQAPKQSDTPLYITLDARRGQAFVQTFSHNLTPLNEALMCDYESVANHAPAGQFFLSGSNLETMEKHLKPVSVTGKSEQLPEAQSVAKMAAVKYLKGELDQGALPLYVRLPDAKVSQK